jgi:primosomal protein N' (replication factor Y)
VVVVRLSGYSRLGVVVEEEQAGDTGPLEEIQAVLDHLSLPPELLELGCWISDSYSVPLPAVLRRALPPGLKELYRVLDPAPDWPWRPGTGVSRTVLRRTLGGAGLRAAEATGRVRLSPQTPQPKTTEWTSLTGRPIPDLGRAPRQRELLHTLQDLGGEAPSRQLLQETGADRATLRRLVERGLIQLDHRLEQINIHNTKKRGGEGGEGNGSLSRHRERQDYEVPERLCFGGVYMWRVPGRGQLPAAVAVARAAVRRGRQALVLPPEKRQVRPLVERLLEEVEGCRVAEYHGDLGGERCAAYEAFGGGELDVLVGTRFALLVPAARLGVVCVVDEPNEAYRGSSAADYESVPFHVREVALERARLEGAGAVMISNVPSLELYARRGSVEELPRVEAPGRPGVVIVDMRGSGEALSSTLLEEVEGGLRSGRVGVLVNRLGYATVVRCNRCGTVALCGRCDLPWQFHRDSRSFVCRSCGGSKPAADRCEVCGSERLSFTGLTVERVREELERTLDTPVGVVTAEREEAPEAGLVVGTAHRILRQEWDVLAIPDADSLLLSGGFRAVERGFRAIFTAGEQARERLVLQTRDPEHYALQAALRRDYAGFARAELSHRRTLEYPPYSCIAVLTLEGGEEAVSRAVESSLPELDPDVRALGPIPLENGSRWRVVLRAPERPAVAASAGRIAREISGARRVKLRVDIDPEEV